MPIGWLYITYHLLREPGNSIDNLWSKNTRCQLAAASGGPAEVVIQWQDLHRFALWRVSKSTRLRAYSMFYRRFSGWWFQTFFMFTPTWGNDPIWLICLNWVETTNQFWIVIRVMGWKHVYKLDGMGMVGVDRHMFKNMYLGVHYVHVIYLIIYIYINIWLARFLANDGLQESPIPHM